MNEHNPIAQLVNHIQRAWLKQTSAQPAHKLVRLMIRPEEARLYEGFCKLESSPHGSLPEVFATHLTNFEDEETFSAALIKDWLDMFDNSQEVITQAGLQWNTAPFKLALANHNNTALDDTLLQLLASFSKAAGRPVVLALIPRQVSSTPALRTWLTTLLKKGVPENVKLAIMDYIGNEQFALHERQFPGQLCAIQAPIDLNAAVQKLAQSGDPNNPEIMLRKCVFEMGAALKDKDVKRLHRWGQTALDATQKSGNKGLFATAHIMYAGMLFHFKRDPKIPELLERGLRIAKQGMQAGDNACPPLVVQFYGYQAAYAQIRRRFTEAIDLFIQQATLGEQQGFGQQALNAWYQAAELCRRKAASRYYDVLEKGYLAGRTLSDEEVSASIYIYILRDYYDYAHANKKTEVLSEIDEKMGRLFGEDWKAEIDRIRKTRAPFSLPQEVDNQ
jgi:hypothetical protein